MPRSCGKEPLETAFSHPERKMSNITRRQGGLQFSLMKKGEKQLCYMLNQSDQKRDVQGKLIGQAREKKKKIARIFCCLQSCGLPRKI